MIATNHSWWKAFAVFYAQENFCDGVNLWLKKMKEHFTENLLQIWEYWKSFSLEIICIMQKCIGLVAKSKDIIKVEG